MKNQMTNTLPVFKGWTVDYRLKEFRRMEYGILPKTASFNSDYGIALLNGYERSVKE